MKAILVAGGAGFIGAQTCKQLALAGYLPVTIDNLATGYREAVRWGPLVEADIRDTEAVTAAIKTYHPEAAIHFAAFSLVGESTRNPAKYYDNNVGAAAVFAGSLRDNGVGAIVFSSTAAVYGNPQTPLIAEDHPKSPINPYGASKLAFEQALHWMAQAGGLEHVILRYFNAAGADPDGEVGESHDPETHLIPLVCKAALGTGHPLNVFGTDYSTRDGTAIRDYIHVVDLAQAHIAAIDYLLKGGGSDTFNVGTGHGLTVREVIEAAEAELGLNVPHSLAPRREGDPETLVADPSRLKRKLGWAPTCSDLPTLIRTAADWQKSRRY